VNAPDIEFMQRALRLAARGLYTTQPNPRVGCVIVKDGAVVGEGWHQRAGEAHAEVLALNAAGEKARAATVYVTLEPCDHTGKTPPCVDALLAAGVSKVIAAMQDPNPLVAGKGLQRLRENGVEVQSGVLEAQARALNPGFIKRMETGLPFVRIKLAMSLDGRTAMASGESKWISSEAARADVQKLRARSSAILTGIGTVLADNPRLDVRIASQHGAQVQPLRVVVDTQLRFPAQAQMCSSNTGGKVLIASCNAESREDLDCDILPLPAGTNGVDLRVLMQELARREANEIHVEAGAKLCGALLEAQLVDEMVIYLAPHLMGDSARGLFSLPGLKEMKDRIELEFSDLRSIGKDLRITARPLYS
jgi:diaminohydroxyphosphoribosylaminopyrimidine deaminase/5-amino-6-(5-phosphoribosylamino)uracil reductase